MGAPGMEALYERLASRHEVTVVAPDRERSGASQSITIDRRLVACPVGAGHWSVDGTPADCVRAGIRALCSGPLDLVVAGINHGANLGTDILLSGTVGAARQAALMGVRSLAVSCVHYSCPDDVRFAADFMAAHIDSLAAILEEGQFLNINIPVSSGPLAIARPGNIRYSVETSCMDSEGGGRSIRLSSRPVPAVEGDAEDWCKACEGAVVLSAFGLWGPDEALEARLCGLLPALSPKSGQLRAKVGAGACLQQGRPRLQEE
jgi:5'/3'-nucleotidase SurE